MKNEEIYLRTDERVEAYKALIKSIQFLKETETDLYNWKWVLISLHNCLQAFMILALKGTSSLSIMKPDHAKKWLQAYETNSKYPNIQLDYFLDLFKKIKSSTMQQYTTSNIFVSSGQIDNSIKELNELRNKFIHFMPMGWSLNITGLPTLSLDVVTILKFLVSESGNIYFYEHNRLEETEQLLEELSCKLVQMLG